MSYIWEVRSKSTVYSGIRRLITLTLYNDLATNTSKHKNTNTNHFPGDQNCAEDRYEEEAYSPNEEGQYVFQFQSLSPDSAYYSNSKWLKYMLAFFVAAAFSS